MSENTRKVFDSREEEVKDLSLVIQTITPVISLIREWGRTERKLSNTAKKMRSLEEENDALDATIKLVKGDIVSILAKEHDKRCEALKKIREKLENACEDFEGEVISYQEYTQRYKWATASHIEMLLKSNSCMDYEWTLALIFLVHNNKSINLFEWNRLVEYIQENVKETFLIEDWNTMLEALKENRI